MKSPAFLTNGPPPDLVTVEFPGPRVVSAAAIIAGDVKVTIQNSVFTVPSSSWYTTV